jgi:UDP-N-acetylmuramate--alanine ligase
MAEIIAAEGVIASKHMKEHDFELVGKRVYMIGIGGCGMSALARMFASRGALVSGSDAVRTGVTDALAACEIEVGFDQTSGRLPDGCDLVIASAAIKPDHPEVLAAQDSGLELLSYAQALGRSMIGRTSVAIAGTHGKSTTVAMLGTALVDAGLDPSVVVGATCPQLVEGTGVGAPLGPPEHLGDAMRAAPTGFRLGASHIPTGDLAGKPGLLIAEACEYNRSFHDLNPTVGAIGSVEADHLDIYGSLDAVVEAFAGFARLVPPAEEGGVLLIAHDGAHRREIAGGLRCKVETIGFAPSADWVIAYDQASRRVELRRGRRVVAEWIMQMPGEHNATNAALACALACTLGADPARVAASLGAFRGLDRRTQLLGTRRLADGGAVRVYDDYGHHPTEVEATLRALRRFEGLGERVGSGEDGAAGGGRGGRLICVFQPHQHSRTRFLMNEFASAFSNADVVIVPHIYFVRDSEAERQKVNARDLVDRLRERGQRAMHVYPFDAIVEQLEDVCRDGDLLVVMGAGPVWQVARGYMDAGRQG